MKVRIGNDIRLKIELALNKITSWKFGGEFPVIFDNPSTAGEKVDIANVHTARAFFVNTTLKEKLKAEFKKKNRFIGRFPIEPFVNEFEPTAYNINSTGFPKYNVVVPNQYRGFGLNPNWKECLPLKERNITVYESEITHTRNAGTIVVDFPAEAQLFPGEYELLVVAQVYSPGYKGNVRTVTSNYKNIFELVEDVDDADVENKVQIEINNEDDTDDVADIYVKSGSYTDDAVNLKRTDGSVVSVDISPVSGWYIEE